MVRLRAYRIRLDPRNHRRRRYHPHRHSPMTNWATESQTLCTVLARTAGLPFSGFNIVFQTGTKSHIARSARLERTELKGLIHYIMPAT
jgi:hypothetical protein